jgi:PAS domain S-box-containing protein
VEQALADPNRSIQIDARAHPSRRRYDQPVPIYICPNCKQRSVDVDGVEGFSDEPVACHSCGFGFLFELMDDYYPGPNTGLVTCDQEARVIAVGRGVFELTGYEEDDLLGRDVREGLGLEPASEQDPVALALEWGVRRLGEPMILRARNGHKKPVICDLFPAYDDDGGLLVAFSPGIGA